MSRTAPPLARVLAVAAQAVAAVLAGRTPEATLAALDGAVRPAALDLAHSTLRDYGRGDFWLARLLHKPLHDRATHALLLVALSRLERRPATAHTVVDQAVAAAAAPYKGLVNAVLRHFLRQADALVAAADADEVAHWRHPRWWLERLRREYPADWSALAAAGNGLPPMCLRINRRRPPNALPPGRALGAHAWLLDKPQSVERLPGFAAGELSVQDWGAQQAAFLLDVAAGQRVLDACAAPGGKTAHLLELADLELTALEIDPQRARRIQENLDRLGLTAQLVVADASQPKDWWDGRPFDRILLDVPCSASGVVRRHPDIKWLRRPRDVARFARQQAVLLDAVWPLLKPGGKMLYCTCSVFAAENAEQIRAFTARQADARRLATGGAALDLQLLPTATHDGFYYALLEKRA